MNEFTYSKLGVKNEQKDGKLSKFLALHEQESKVTKSATYDPESKQVSDSSESI